MNGRDRLARWCGWLLLLTLALRLLSLGLYPLTDTTEARYAEMARKMLDSGNWLTPMFDVGVPFWGKPPLSFWLSALPMALLGVSEFTARLGPLLAACFTLALFWQWPSPETTGTNSGPANASKKRANNAIAIGASLVFLSTPLGFIASGAVMTDMAMVAGTSLSMVAFWRCVGSPKDVAPKRWGWLFFVGQAVGLMAKGPVAVVLSGLAIGAWVVWQGAWRTTLPMTWQRLPWLRGAALVLLLVAPWYLLAEQATPGFLRYFIVGEHWSRFTQSGWKGDLYGVAHAQPKGRIWLFALVATLPWALAALWWAVKRRRTASAFESSGERAYLLCWALSPCVFFTLSGNILPAYVLPGLPAFALLVARLWLAQDSAQTAPGRQRLGRWALGLGALLTPVAFTAMVGLAPARFDHFSDKALLQGAPPQAVVYLLERPDSGMFYTRGLARRELAVETLPQLLQDTRIQRLLLPVGQVAAWQDTLQAQGWAEYGRNKLSVAFERGRPRP